MLKIRMNTLNIGMNLLNMSESSDKESPDPLAFGGDDTESEEASEYVCYEDESSQTESLKNYKVLEAIADRVLALPHTPEVDSSNQASPSGSLGLAVASASEGVDIRVGISLARRNALIECCGCSDISSGGFSYDFHGYAPAWPQTTLSSLDTDDVGQAGVCAKAI
ncbi:unnamed protein product [Prunus armeniaca]